MYSARSCLTTKQVSVACTGFNRGHTERQKKRGALLIAVVHHLNNNLFMKRKAALAIAQKEARSHYSPFPLKTVSTQTLPEATTTLPSAKSTGLQNKNNAMYALARMLSSSPATSRGTLRVKHATRSSTFIPDAQSGLPPLPPPPPVLLQGDVHGGKHMKKKTSAPRTAINKRVLLYRVAQKPSTCKNITGPFTREQNAGWADTSQSRAAPSPSIYYKVAFAPAVYAQIILNPSPHQNTRGRRNRQLKTLDVRL